MRGCCNRCVSLVAVALLATAVAQEEAGVLSYIDIEGGGLGVAACLAEEPDPRACAPNVEVVALEALRACGGNPSGCEEKVAYPVPFIPEAAGRTIEGDMDEAWEAFVDRAIDELGRNLNQLPPCWLPTPCPPTIDWGCVVERMTDALATALSQYLPLYWASVYESVALHAPFALHWRSALPGDGALIAPVFSMVPKPEQYAGLLEEPRDSAYYFQGPQFPRRPVPYAPGEPDARHGGLNEKEETKRALQPATLLEYQQFGFVTLFEIRGAFRLELLFKLERGPYLMTACLIPVPPFILPVPIPVPTPLQAPKASSDWPSVPEGYSIPNVEGTPLF